VLDVVIVQLGAEAGLVVEGALIALAEACTSLRAANHERG
jgi:hypothetical protein